ncbi:MAG: His/Glu/Gln/Arg/opine family amino acid ABC transporter permease subunit [Gammaproteobacteria bacterium]|jgi:His/Glu/Gln/Arg/opine family amino acid ABC transporter permease subunit
MPVQWGVAKGRSHIACLSHLVVTTFGNGSKQAQLTLKFDFSYWLDALPRLQEGASTTIDIALAGFTLSLLVATAPTVIRNSVPFRQIAFLLAGYIRLIRGTLILAQDVSSSYVLPTLRIELHLFVTRITAITLDSTSYVLEIFRGRLYVTPRGRVEPVRSLGLRAPRFLAARYLAATAVQMQSPTHQRIHFGGGNNRIAHDHHRGGIGPGVAGNFLLVLSSSPDTAESLL